MDDIPSWDAVHRRIQGGRLELVSSESLQGYVFKLISDQEFILKMVVLSSETEGLLYPDGHRSVILSRSKTTSTLSQFAREYSLQKFVHDQTDLSVNVFDFSYMDWFASRKLLDELRLISDPDTQGVIDTLKSYKRAIGIMTMDVAKGTMIIPSNITTRNEHYVTLQNKITAQMLVLFTHCHIIDIDTNVMVDGSNITLIDFGKAIHLDHMYQQDTILDFYDTKAGTPFTYSNVKLTVDELIYALKKIAILHYCIFKTYYATDDTLELLVFDHLFKTPRGWGETPEGTTPYHFNPSVDIWVKMPFFDENISKIMELYQDMSTYKGEYYPPTHLSNFDQTKSFCKGGLCERVTRAFTYVAGKRKRRRTRKK